MKKNDDTQIASEVCIGRQILRKYILWNDLYPTVLLINVNIIKTG